jgi:hypothetical protein
MPLPQRFEREWRRATAQKEIRMPQSTAGRHEHGDPLLAPTGKQYGLRLSTRAGLLAAGPREQSAFTSLELSRSKIQWHEGLPLAASSCGAVTE